MSKVSYRFNERYIVLISLQRWLDGVKESDELRPWGLAANDFELRQQLVPVEAVVQTVRLLQLESFLEGIVEVGHQLWQAHVVKQGCDGTHNVGAAAKAEKEDLILRAVELTADVSGDVFDLLVNRESGSRLEDAAAVAHSLIVTGCLDDTAIDAIVGGASRDGALDFEDATRIVVTWTVSILSRLAIKKARTELSIFIKLGTVNTHDQAVQQLLCHDSAALRPPVLTVRVGAIALDNQSRQVRSPIGSDCGARSATTHRFAQVVTAVNCECEMQRRSSGGRQRRDSVTVFSQCGAGARGGHVSCHINHLDSRATQLLYSVVASQTAALRDFVR